MDQLDTMDTVCFPGMGTVGIGFIQSHTLQPSFLEDPSVNSERPLNTGGCLLCPCVIFCFYLISCQLALTSTRGGEYIYLFRIFIGPPFSQIAGIQGK